MQPWPLPKNDNLPFGIIKSRIQKFLRNLSTCLQDYSEQPEPYVHILGREEKDNLPLAVSNTALVSKILIILDYKNSA